MIENNFDIQSLINEKLKAFDLSLNSSTRLSESIKKQSDFYISHPDNQTPWKEKWGQIAQLSYYLPLNFWRAQRVIKELQRYADQLNIKNIIDYGSGLGAASLALRSLGWTQPIVQFEPFAPIDLQISHQPPIQFESKWHSSFVKPGSLGFFSYSLTEIKNPMAILKLFDHLVIIEPSTQTDGRKLSDLRKQLIADGYIMLAPCTHQGHCPLTEHSKKDWCHDRLVLNQPSWLLKIENHLPFKNRSLTFSYLIATRTQNSLTEDAVGQPKAKNLEHTLARTVGDLLQEKGKTRQLVCANDDRLFLSWLKKNKISQEIPRGTLIKWPKEFEQVGNEIRLLKKIEYDL